MRVFVITHDNATYIVIARNLMAAASHLLRRSIIIDLQTVNYQEFDLSEGLKTVIV